MKKKVLLTVASGVLVLGGSFATEDAFAKKGKKEKCYGVVKAGENDCGNAQGTHSCAAQSTVDNDGGEWVYVPKGLCDRLTSGSLEPKLTETEDKS